MHSRQADWRLRFSSLAHAAAPLGPLLARLTVGAVFLTSGSGKLHHLAPVVTYFAKLGLPSPGVLAPLVGITELVCGALVVVGLLARLAAIPLAFTMLVALATAKAAKLDSLGALLGMEEFLYLVMLAWLLVAGPGRFSIDHLLARRADRPVATTPRAQSAYRPSNDPIHT